MTKCTEVGLSGLAAHIDLGESPLALDDAPPPPTVEFRSLGRPHDDIGAVARAVEHVLSRAASHLLLLPFGYRLAGLATGEIAILGAHGWSGSGAAFCFGLALIAYQAGAIGVLRRFQTSGRPLAWSLLLADLTVSGAANLIVAAPVFALADRGTVELSWLCLTGTAALWTLGRGVLAGIGVVGFGAVLQEAMLALHGSTAEAAIGNRWGHELWLAGAVAVSAACAAAIAIIARTAVAHGIRAGQQAERAATLRGVHDTVLQTLETISLLSTSAGPDSVQRLREVGQIAANEAAKIRRDLDRIERVPTALVDGLTELVAEATGSGLRLEIAANLPAATELPTARRIALIGAAREATTNVIKHAQVEHAVLSLLEIDGGVQVTVRDHGVGFDEARPGFGISQSIAARLAEVGGRATVTSRTGGGTRVVMWVPAQ